MSPLALSLVVLASPVDGGLDPVMVAMKAEVARAMTLTMPPRKNEPAPERPYYVNASVGTEDTVSVRADLGALYAPSSGRRIRLNTEVRVGSPKLDNTNFSGGYGYDFGFSRASSPAEEDVDAIRRGLWLAFDADYKSAVEAIARKRAYLKANQVKENPPDWGPAPVETVVLSLEAPLELDVERWSGIARRSSAACRSFPSPHTCSVSLTGRRDCQRLVASDGTMSRVCESRLEVVVNAQGQAPDGMLVGWEWRTLAREEKDLPDEAALIARVKEVGETLEKKVKAGGPAEDYMGPVLFTGAAAPAFFLSALGTPLSHPHANLGANEQGRLTDRLGKHVAVNSLSAVDDPTRERWTSPSGEVLPLMGFFPVDDEGVRPKPVSLVEKGVLRSFYMSRVPTQRVAATNGHARAGKGSVGNLFITTDAPTPLKALKAKLIELAKDEDLDFGLMVSVLPRGQYDRPASSQLSLPNLPLLVHRLYADGREELVRGFAFKPASFRVLKDLAGLGDDPTLLNTEQLGQNVSVVAPSVLVRVLELSRPGDDSKPPQLPRPVLPK